MRFTHARTWMQGGRLLTRCFPLAALILLLCVCALPALAQERLPAPPAVRTMYSVVYGREGNLECHSESGECIGYEASKCIGMMFKINSGTVASDYSMRITSGKNPVKIVDGFSPYPTSWFNIAEWRVNQAPHISGGIFLMDTWHGGDNGTHANYNLCGLASGQSVKIRFRVIDNREDSPYRYGEKTDVIKVEI